MSTSVYKAYGKWILTGEHSVLRGCPALVFPLRQHFMEFTYTLGTEDIKIEIKGQQKKTLTLLLWGVLEEAIEKAGKSRSDIKGHLEINSQIPFGTGLGASATLCVCVAKWFVDLSWVKEADVYHFARSLEDLFHGESSGVDIAAALSETGVIFNRESLIREPIKMNWQPQLFLSYCGARGVTSECIQKAKQIREKSQQLFNKIDDQMKESAHMAIEALADTQETGLKKLIRSIDLARDCFHQWGLDDGLLGEHMRKVSEGGALAVKPTGSGGGGYVLSLWQDTPPKDLEGFTVP